MKCLMIGGAADGNFVEVPEPTPREVRFPVNQPLDVSPQMRPPPAATMPAQTFHLMRLRIGEAIGKPHEYSLYVVSGMTNNEAIRRLIGHYKPNVQ